MSAISWTLVIMAAFFLFLAIFIANGTLEKIELVVASLAFDFVALGMFLGEYIGAKEEREKSRIKSLGE